MVAIEDVILLAAADKYVVVHTARREFLIRESLRELLPQLNPADFTQIHRGSIVNLNYVQAADRAENGKLTLRLNGLNQQPIVSRLYAHLFKAM